MIPIFIGYDPKQTIAYHVCCSSIIRNSSVPVKIIPLHSDLFGHTNRSDSSTSFNYLRFHIPFLMGYSGWAIYIDSDMLFLDDVKNLWNLKDKNKSLMVVKHDYTTKFNKKFFNQDNKDYPRKNWSSVILWNCGHHKVLTPELIENSSGEYLHRFFWLKDDEIGELPKEWNWLVKEYEENPLAKLLHFTIGIPDILNEKESTFSNSAWYFEKNKMLGKQLL